MDDIQCRFRATGPAPSAIPRMRGMSQLSGIGPAVMAIRRVRQIHPLVSGLWGGLSQVVLRDPSIPRRAESERGTEGVYEPVGRPSSL